MSKFLVVAFYKFVALPNYQEMQEPLLMVCDSNAIKGTLLLASEGINGTVSGTELGIQKLLKYLQSMSEFRDLSYKKSWAYEMPFLRMKVRLKKEIVTMGVPGTDPKKIVGSYVKPEKWNELINDPNVILVDTRNNYEVEIGTFKGAINPQTTNFRNFPEWVQRNEDIFDKPKIAMFCTGGIRCEKSTAYMKEQGYEEVYHLEGGILKYLEEVPREESLWEGECFVFDNRVSIKHGLEEGSYDQCYGCRWPITDDDKKSKNYIKGICCSRCFNNISKEKKTRSAERQKQIDLAEKRGRKHIAINIEEARNNSSEEKNRSLKNKNSC